MKKEKLLNESKNTQMGNDQGVVSSSLLGPKFKKQLNVEILLSGRDQGSYITNIEKDQIDSLVFNLHKLADRYYAGDTKAVDAFLQVYGLDRHRP